MQRETVKITQTTLARIARMVQTGHARDHEIADTVVPGLLIRVRKRRANWALRCRVKGEQFYFTIGSIVALGDPDTVRAAAERAKRLLREGGDPAPLFESLMHTPTVAAAEARAAHRAGKVWDWDQARAKFLEACLADNRPDTTRTYRSASGLVDLAGLKRKIITEITSDDIRRIRDFDPRPRQGRTIETNDEDAEGPLCLARRTTRQRTQDQSCQGRGDIRKGSAGHVGRCDHGRRGVRQRRG